MPTFRDEHALAVATQALQATQTLGLPITLPLIDDSPVGSFWCRVGVTVNVAATNVGIQLPRLPSGRIIFESSNGAEVFRTAADVAASSSTVYVCRATAQTVVTMLIA